MLSPVKDKLGKKRLVVVADGALQYIPFAALADLTPQPPSLQGNGEKEKDFLPSPRRRGTGEKERLSPSPPTREAEEKEKDFLPLLPREKLRRKRKTNSPLLAGEGLGERFPKEVV